MTETITVNGTDLSTLVSNVESLTGMVKTPQIRNELVVVPAVHGRVGRQVPLFDAGEVTWPMWVVGADSVTGVDLTGDAAVVAYYKAARDLTRLFHDPVLTLQHVVTGQPTLVATAQMADAPLDFTRQLGSPLFGRFVATLDVPGAFWETLAAVDAGPFTVATGTSSTLTGFAGADAPMDELVLRIGQQQGERLARSVDVPPVRG